MPRQARTVADVLLGEAVHGSRQQRYADMLGIASVISNRARQTGTTPQAVISAPDQFSAYGKSLPDGVNAYRDLAEQAINQVQISGPVHNATYYATPKATKNLPSGLVSVAATTGHQYFVDPVGRAIRTAVGTIKPAVDAVQDTLGGLLPSNAPAPSARPAGMAALAPNGLQYDLSGARRNQVPTSGIGLKVADIASGVMPGITTNLYSGMEPRGRAPVGSAYRHPMGFAGDFNFRDAIGQPVTDPVALHDIAMGMAAKHNANIGFGPEYMGRTNMHIDTMPVGPGGFPGGKQWGSTAKTWGKNLEFARETGIGPTPYSGAPTPFGRDEANPNDLSYSMENAEPSFAAPVGEVVRGAALAPPSPARPDNAQFAGPQGTFSVTGAPPSTPSPSDMAAAYGQLASTMSQAGVPMVGLPEQMAKSMIRPAAPPVAPPAPVAPPPAPVVQAVPRPVETIAPIVTPPQQSFPSAPQAPTVRSFTPSDVYSGQASMAADAFGNMVSRDNLGRTAVTNKFGVTTATMPDGKQAAISGPLGSDIQPGSLFSGFGEQTKGNFGKVAKSVIGSVGGAALGGMVAGPIGSLVGGAIGRELAAGGTLGGLFGNKTSSALGRDHFPDRPEAPKGSIGSRSNRSMSGMRSISPGAAAAIGAGRAGLY